MSPVLFYSVKAQLSIKLQNFNLIKLIKDYNLLEIIGKFCLFRN